MMVMRKRARKCHCCHQPCSRDHRCCRCFKVAGADDPAFSGTVEALWPRGSGRYQLRASGGEEAAGVYVGALTALYTQNGNYRVAVLNGTFTITAAPVTPPTPPTPPTRRL
ncbi:MAG: MBG domain-containing protein [Eggerthellaceae bacterium]